MDLTQLTNLGEFIGGVAVIGSLIFVGVQIQRNARAVRQSSTHGAIETWARMNEALGANGESAALLSEALPGAPDDLTEPEFARVGFARRACTSKPSTSSMKTGQLKRSSGENTSLRGR